VDGEKKNVIFRGFGPGNRLAEGEGTRLSGQGGERKGGKRKGYKKVGIYLRGWNLANLQKYISL